MATATVGFIGPGKMGRPLARRLLAAGFEVTDLNRGRAVVDELAREGARPLMGGLALELYGEAVQLGHGDQEATRTCRR
jgi:6-phosphogluconate dehydrogenase (decarboxylating)